MHVGLYWFYNLLGLYNTCFSWSTSPFYIWGQKKKTNECNTIASIQELILTLNFVSRFRPPLKAFLAQVALPVEFSDPIGCSRVGCSLDRWTGHSPSMTTHHPLTTEEYGWARGAIPRFRLPALLAGSRGPSPLKGVHTLVSHGENHSSAGSAVGCRRRWTSLINLLPTQKFNQPCTGNNTLKLETRHPDKVEN